MCAAPACKCDSEEGGTPHVRLGFSLRLFIFLELRGAEPERTSFSPVLGGFHS